MVFLGSNWRVNDLHQHSGRPKSATLLRHRLDCEAIDSPRNESRTSQVRSGSAMRVNTSAFSRTLPTISRSGAFERLCGDATIEVRVGIGSGKRVQKKNKPASSASELTCQNGFGEAEVERAIAQNGTPGVMAACLRSGCTSEWAGGPPPLILQRRRSVPTATHVWNGSGKTASAGSPTVEPKVARGRRGRVSEGMLGSAVERSAGTRLASPPSPSRETCASRSKLPPSPSCRAKGRTKKLRPRAAVREDSAAPRCELLDGGAANIASTRLFVLHRSGVGTSMQQIQTGSQDTSEAGDRARQKMSPSPSRIRSVSPSPSPSRSSSLRPGCHQAIGIHHSRCLPNKLAALGG
eukprot:TRINITY_DN20550_c0_g1_i1.p1 TRINITY_DN20550_c0_g1~~TRINITY_DN20550_c0_g1_i1.p1  ORF type:complete len:372 (+),score=37.26 TRINITY_DN20550_c0_g1_i1:64-1116(+)